MNFGASPIDVRQIRIDGFGVRRPAAQCGPVHVEEIVAVGPARFGHHLIPDKKLIRVPTEKPSAGLVDRSVVGGPSCHGIGAVYGHRFAVVRGNCGAGIWCDGFAVGPGANGADGSGGNCRRTLLNGEIRIRDRSWIHVTAIRRDKAYVAWNAAGNCEGSGSRCAAARRLINDW